MYKQDVPTVGKLLDICEFPIESNQISLQDSIGTMQESVIEYYRRNPKFAVTSYDFLLDDVIVSSVDSLLGRPFDAVPRVDSIDLTTYSFSDYSTGVLESLGINLSQSWNGDISFVVYNDGETIVGETDYYSFETVSRLLQYESIYASQISDGPSNVKTKDFPLRNELLRGASDFLYPSRPLTASSGGVIITNTPNGWRLILGRRSRDLDTNPGMISVFPNGGVEYSDLWGGGFSASARREFGSELYSGDIETARKFLQKYTVTEEVCCGWNLRDGSLFFGNLFVISEIDGYDAFYETRELNEEIAGLVELDIFDVNEVTRYLSPSMMSGDAIAIVCEALDAFDRNPMYPDLPYTIRSRLK